VWKKEEGNGRMVSRSQQVELAYLAYKSDGGK
jgi:hypothetical protein